MRKLVIGFSISAAIVGGMVLAQFMTNGSAASQPAENSNFITEKEAKEIALKEVNGTINEFEFDNDDRNPHYEFEIHTSNEEVDVEVDADSGKVKVTDHDAIEKTNAAGTKPGQESGSANNQDRDEDKQSGVLSQEDVISKAEAINIASSVAKGTVAKVELDSDDDHQTKTYELEFKDGKTEYDVEVDAYTGKILEVDQDIED